jgi:hypothetical protein
LTPLSLEACISAKKFRTGPEVDRSFSSEEYMQEGRYGVSFRRAPVRNPFISPKEKGGFYGKD